MGMAGADARVHTKRRVGLSHCGEPGPAAIDDDKRKVVDIE